MTSRPSTSPSKPSDQQWSPLAILLAIAVIGAGVVGVALLGLGVVGALLLAD